MFQIDFIRHTSLQITPDLCYGQTDIQVSESFPEEAEKVKQSLQGRTYDAVFTSPLSRAKKLCYYCGYEDVAVTDDRIIERDFGEWELKTWTEVDELIEHHDDPSAFIDHLGQIVPPGGEAVEDLFNRVYSFIQDVQLQRYRRVAVFCHGGVINSARYFQELIGIDDLFIDIRPYGSVTTLSYPYLDEKRMLNRGNSL